MAARGMSGDLVEKAAAASATAYAPYSRYLVGAVVGTNARREFAGVKRENAAHPPGVCAEKTAIGAAVTAGYGPGEIAAIGITASPCGGCRQWLYEFRIAEVSYRSDSGELRTVTCGELLPDTWNLPG